MSLKDLTKDKHTLAEQTKFMKALFKGKMPKEVWADFIYQKMLCYNAIEIRAAASGLLDSLPDLARTYRLYQDFKELTKLESTHTFSPEAAEYHRYLLGLDSNKLMAHIYVWYLGDLSGGQMIKKVAPGSNLSLEFQDPQGLSEKIRSKLTDDMADEANLAFDYAIKILSSYDGRLE